jgi:TANFOR domain-containing protein
VCSSEHTAFLKTASHMQRSTYRSTLPATLTVLLIALITLLSSEAKAQLNLSISIIPPYSPNLSDYRSDPSKVLVTILNPTSTTYRVRISGYAQNTSGAVRIDTRDDRTVPVIIVPPGSRTLTGGDLSLFDPSAVSFTGTDATTIQRTGRLPEGTYEVCIRALNFDDITEVLSGPSPACTSFNIMYVEPPHTRQPTCESTITTTSPQLINFMWDATNPPLISTDYLFTIVEVPAGRDPYEAFRTRTSPPFFERTLSNQTSFTYSVTEPAMQLGRTYAWRVKAVDPTRQSIIRNNGESDVCTFVFGTGTGTGTGGTGTGSGTLTALEAVYPANGDVIPWLPPHIVVRFNDYSDEITSMNYTLTVRGDDGSTQTSTRTLNWPDGPRRGQGWPDASYNERSRYIIVDQETSGGAPTPSSWASTLRRGVRYTWSVNARFRYQGRDVNLSTEERTFSIGATTPQLVSPSDRARFAPADQPITLEWRNERPEMLNPPDLIGVSRGSSSMFFGLSDEQWRLELSRDSTFGTRDTNVTRDIEVYYTGDAADALYANRTLTLGRRDTGTYYWRVSWLRPDGSVYSRGGPWSFSIGNPSDTATRRDTTARPPGACRDDCSSPAITNTTPSTRTYNAGDMINVGRFQMRIVRSTGSGSSLSGDGTIQVPFLRAPINVEFSGIRVNSDNAMFDGRITAKTATEAPISSDVANALSGTGLTNDQASSISTFVSQTSRLVSTFTSSTPVSLPVGFNNLIEGEQFVVGIIGMVFTPTQAKLNAAMSFPIPDLGPGVGLGLGARDICFHPAGIGGNGEATLYLVSDLGYREPDTWGFVFKAQSSTDSGTYVQFDCNGFKELRLSAQCEFPRTWLKPQPDDGHSLSKASFKTTIRRNGDWIASASLDRSEIVGAPGFILEAREVAFDHSNVRNPTGISFPTGFTGDRTSAWQGFYIGRAAVSLPPELRTFEDDRPVQISVVNLMIGSGGFTASFRAENVIRYPAGNFGEWGASIDTIAVDIVSNSLRSGSLIGSIKIPISDSGIYYRCTLGRPTTGTGLGFEFVVQPRDTISAQIWSARVYLAPTSRIELSNMSGRFQAMANLTGGITIAGDLGGISDLGFRGIHFQDFRVQSTDPYVNAGTWSFASENHSMAGFPLSISGLNVVAGMRRGRPAAGIQFTISLNLQPGSNAISGGTTLSIWGRMSDAASGGQSFQFDGVQLDSIGISADMGVVQIAGALNIYNEDATFGNGFKGSIRANFLRQVIVEAVVQFGEVRSFRYWYVDASATFSTAIPVFTGVGIYGFGGGAWSHMRREGAEPPVPNVATASTTTDRSSTPGRTVSGYRFVPDNTQAFGFRAKIVIGTMPSSEGFNADVAIGATFLEAGGIGEIFIEGAGYMMASVTNRSEAKVTANVDIRYNFPTSTFHGIFTVAINADPFTGGGTMVIHGDPAIWYIKIGEPWPVANRVNLSLGSWLNVNAYVMAGMDLPGPPPLPDEITRILGPLPVVRNPALSRGDGFAFGASASLNTGRQQFLIFYGRAALTVGFDLSLLRFGPDATCEGIPGRIGVNGWYAQGQLYASISASVGIYVDLLFTSGEFEILGIDAAAAIQAGFPNPAWMLAAVGGEYRILGGAVSGRCNFTFKLGEECIPPVESPLASIDIITDMQPQNGASNVDVFVEPQTAFSLVLDDPFELTELDGRGLERVRTFRVKVRDYSVTKASNGQRVPGTWSVNPDKTIITFASQDALDPRVQYRQYVAAYGEEYVTGRWQRATRRDGGSIEQTEEARFTTGDAPDDIPARNVAYSYPLDRQRYFLRGECPTGELKLKRGQPYLFAQPVDRSKTVTVKARFIPTMGSGSQAGTPVPPGSSNGEFESVVTYNASAKTLTYAMPALSNTTSYAVQFVRKEESNRPSPLDPMIARLVEANQGVLLPMRLLYNRAGSNVNQLQRALPGPRARAGEKNLYYYYFKTSQYNTMREKLAAMEPMPAQRLTPLGNFEIVRAKFSKPEGVDVYDVDGYEYEDAGRTYRVGPLLRVSAYTRTMDWHRRFTEPFVYSAIERIRRTYGYPLVTEWNRYAQSSYLKIAEWNTRGEGPITDAEMLPPRFATFTLGGRASGLLGTGTGLSLGGGYGLGSGVGLSSAGTMFEQPSLRIDFMQGIVVPWDWQRVRARAAYLYGFYCCEFGTADDFNFLRATMNHPYEMLYRGRYRLDFVYGWCQSPDDTHSVPKEFVY